MHSRYFIPLRLPALALIALVPAAFAQVARTPPASAAVEAAQSATPALPTARRLDERMTLPTDKMVLFRNATTTENFRKLAPARQLKEAFSKFMNLSKGIPTDTPLTSVMATSYADLEKAGFAYDAVYVSHAVDVLQSGRIIGPTDLDTFHPDCVAVGISPFQFCCSGTLIAPQLVLTAGHCADECAQYVLFGSAVDAPERKTYKVKAIRRHPGFKQTKDTIVDDLTLLVLESPVTDVSPRLIATAAEVTVAKEAWIVGYGTTNSAGTIGYGKRRIGGPALFADSANSAYGCDAATEVVLGKHPANLDSCKGDSGGPIYILTSDGEFLAGATSRGVRNAVSLCGDGGIYVRPDAFISWMQTVAVEFQVSPPVVR